MLYLSASDPMISVSFEEYCHIFCLDGNQKEGWQLDYGQSFGFWLQKNLYQKSFLIEHKHLEFFNLTPSGYWEAGKLFCDYTLPDIWEEKLRLVYTLSDRVLAFQALPFFERIETSEVQYQTTWDEKNAFLVGKFFMKKKDYKKALPHFQKALEAGNNASELFYDLGLIHESLNQLEKALEHYQKASAKNHASASIKAKELQGRLQKQHVTPASSLETPLLNRQAAIPASSLETPLLNRQAVIPASSLETPLLNRQAAIPASSLETPLLNRQASQPTLSFWQKVKRFSCCLRCCGNSSTYDFVD